MDRRELYDEMEGLLNKDGWPEAYKTDFTNHDNAWLEKTEYATRGAIPPFGWVVYDCGTHLVDVRMTRGSFKGFLEHFRVNGQRYRYHIYNGVSLDKAESFDVFIDQVERLNEKHTEGNPWD